MSTVDASPSNNGHGSDTWSPVLDSFQRRPPKPRLLPGDVRPPADQHDHGDDRHRARRADRADRGGPGPQRRRVRQRQPRFLHGALRHRGRPGRDARVARPPRRLSRAPVVSIASIRGRARGAGSEFVLACDLRFASREKAVLGQFEVGTGVVPSGGPTARLPRLVGRGRALEILLVADDLDGPRAEQYGYVNRAIADDQLDVEVEAIATAARALRPRRDRAHEGAGRPGHAARLTAQAGTGSESELGSAFASSRREWIPSLANTLRRCHSTVRGLRNSRAPISGLDSPSRANWAICRSCAVSSSRVSTVRLRTFSPVACSSRPGAFGERLHPDRRELLIRGAELRAGVDAAILASQPLAVEQVRACELRAQSGAAQPLDSLSIQALGGLALAHQRAGTGPDAERPVGLRNGGRGSNALVRRARELGVAASRGGLEQLDRGPHGDEQLRRVVARVPGGGRRLLVAAKAIDKHRACPACVLDRRSLPPGRALLDGRCRSARRPLPPGPGGLQAQGRRRARPGCRWRR